MVRDMAHHFDSMSEEGLHRFLTGAAVERGERFVVEQRGGESFAEFRSPSALTGEVVPLGEEAVVFPDEVVMLSANGPDRRTAMLRLADLVTMQDG